MIWWLWTAFRPAITKTIDLAEWWDVDPDDRDVAWLGETAWTGRGDTMGLGLRGR